MVMLITKIWGKTYSLTACGHETIFLILVPAIGFLSSLIYALCRMS